LIGLTIVAYFVVYFLFRKNKEAFYGYVERAAAKNNGEVPEAKTKVA
jgi:PTS system galactitol-specific IIC component